jgi:hypothetical protein
MWSTQIAISIVNRALIDACPVSEGFSHVVDRMLRVVEDLGVKDGNRKMGIDIFMSVPSGFCEDWNPNKSIHERDGYLRESFHGKPYATRYFVEEAFKADQPVAIATSVLRARLPATVMIAN